MSKAGNHQLRALYVVNKHLPPGDYRFMYPDFSTYCSATYALPVNRERADDSSLVNLGVGEGFKPKDFVHYLRLLHYLIRNRDRVDFVHYYSTILMLVGPWLALLAGLPSVVTVTGFGRVFSSDNLKYRLLKPLYKVLFGLVVCLSRGVQFQNGADLETVAGWYPQHKEKLFYVGSAVDVPVREVKDFFRSRLRVLLVARLIPDKGIDDFLNVAERLHSECLEFVLVGPRSTGFNKLAGRVEDAVKREIITYLGELDPDAAQEQFREAHMFFFPSSYGEGLARVLLEAGHARVCPIAYDIPPNRDLIAEGRGFLAPVGDTKEVVEIMNCLLNDRATLERNARTYQSFVVEHYNMTTFARRQDAILEQLFGG